MCCVRGTNGLYSITALVAGHWLGWIMVIASGLKEGVYLVHTLFSIVSLFAT